MKKVVWLLSLFLVLSVSSMGCAANAPEPASDSSALSPVTEPLDLAYGNDNVSSSAVFETQYFPCTSDSGSALRYWFQNDGSSPCTVQLYKKTILGLAYTQEPFTVAPGEQGSQVFNDPDGTTFKIRVTATDGGVVAGALRADQLDAATS